MDWPSMYPGQRYVPPLAPVSTLRGGLSLPLSLPFPFLFLPFLGGPLLALSRYHDSSPFFSLFPPPPPQVLKQQVELRDGLNGGEIFTRARLQGTVTPSARHSRSLAPIHSSASRRARSPHVTPTSTREDDITTSAHTTTTTPPSPPLLLPHPLVRHHHCTRRVRPAQFRPVACHGPQSSRRQR